MPAETDADAVARYLRRRRIFRRAGLCLLILIGSSVVLGHLIQWRAGGDDWSRFDRRRFAVVDVPSGDTLIIAEPTGGRTPLHLLGVAAPEALPTTQPAYWFAESRQALADRVNRKPVLIRLPTLPVKSPAGLFAYVYLQDGQKESLNEQLIAAGEAYADRRTTHPFHKQFDQSEMDARIKKRGLWKGVRDDQQPQWRREWFERLRRQREAEQ